MMGHPVLENGKWARGPEQAGAELLSSGGRFLQSISRGALFTFRET
jgi:hypothetical protein